MTQNVVRRLRTDDTGMTVVEVVVAAAILFFVLTAVLGLVGATTQTSISARQRTVMTNAVASYLDYARGLPFAAVGISGVDTGGVLPAVETTTSAYFTVTLTATVREGAYYRTKEVQVNAECTAPGHPPIHTRAFAVIRDRARGMTMTQAAGGPRISFHILTPAEGAVLYDSNVAGAGALYIDADASSDSGQITVLEFMADGYRLRDGHTASAQFAGWTPGLASITESFRWDTRQLDETSSVPAIQDGWRLVRVEAVDDQGRHAWAERRFLVDNHAPSVPGTPTAVSTGWKDTTVLLNWDPSLDGTDPAYRYNLAVYKDTGAADYDHWASAGTFELTSPAHTLVTTPFARYFAWVNAISPRGLPSSKVDALEPFYSRPLLSGTATCTVTGSGPSTTSNVDLQLGYSPPDFPVSGVTYDLYRGTSLFTLAPYRSAITLPYSETIVDTIGDTGSPIAYYYQVRVSFTPSGWGGGTAQTVSSNVAGPTSVVSGTGGTLVSEW